MKLKINSILYITQALLYIDFEARRKMHSFTAAVESGVGEVNTSESRYNTRLSRWPSMALFQ